MSEWIKIDEKSPEHNQIVLVCDEISSLVTIAKFREHYESEDDEDDFSWYVMNIDCLEIDYCVTHWMLLPLGVKDD